MPKSFFDVMLDSYKILSGSLRKRNRLLITFLGILVQCAIKSTNRAPFIFKSFQIPFVYELNRRPSYQPCSAYVPTKLFLMPFYHTQWVERRIMGKLLIGIRGEAANPTICYVLSHYWLLIINSVYTGTKNFWEKVRIFECPALSQE